MSDAAVMADRPQSVKAAGVLLCLTVFGKPQPAGSKRAFALRKGGELTGRVAVTDDNPKAKSWQREVKIAALAAVEEQACDPDDEYYVLLDGPLAVQMTFYLARPKGHYGTGRNSATLKPSAPAFPIVKPDSLKLARGTEDALTGVVYGDDAQVVDLDVRKCYGLPERCEIVIRDALADELDARSEAA